jgi:Uma2 family endonuclease
MGAVKLEEIPRYTYEDYKHWSDKWEIIFGIAYAMSPAPMIKHQSVSANIAWQLKELLQDCSHSKALLPVDWKIAQDTIVQPDNLVICHKPTHDAYISKAPKIIFEILSKSTASKDTNLKYKLYESEAVEYYIIVNPDDCIAKVYKLKDGTYKKIYDATDKMVEFELKECSSYISFDFAKIWS